MLKEKKRQIIDELAVDLSRSTIVITTGYQGVTAREMIDFRRTLAGTGVNYRVIKNTLACLAAQRAGKEKLVNIIDGPTALAFGYDDVGQVAKVINRYVKSTGLVMQIKGGLIGERVLSADEVIVLANLPSRNELISQLVAEMQTPVRRLHNVLSSPLVSLYNVLQARIQDITE